MNRFRAIRNFKIFDRIKTNIPNLDLNLIKIENEVWTNKEGDLICLEDLEELLSNKIELENRIVNKYVIIVQVNYGTSALNLYDENIKNKTYNNVFALGKVTKINYWASYSNEKFLQVHFCLDNAFCPSYKASINSWTLNQGISEIIEITEEEYLKIKSTYDNQILSRNLIEYVFQTQKSCELTDVNEIDEAN